ncbi:MAG: hypothetical protein GY749_02875 [Desulfobacteraceae bacterium]|nr:hypothetical protein [Desulfobacteraceae bacterium]
MCRNKIQIIIVFFVVILNLCIFGFLAHYYMERTENAYHLGIQSLAEAGATQTERILSLDMFGNTDLWDNDYKIINYNEFVRRFCMPNSDIPYAYFKKIGSGKNTRYSTSYSSDLLLNRLVSQYLETLVSVRYVENVYIADKNNYMPWYGSDRLSGHRDYRIAGKSPEADLAGFRSKTKPAPGENLHPGRMTAKSPVVVRNRLWGYFAVVYRNEIEQTRNEITEEIFMLSPFHSRFSDHRVEKWNLKP